MQLNSWCAAQPGRLSSTNEGRIWRARMPRSSSIGPLWIREWQRRIFVENTLQDGRLAMAAIWIYDATCCASCQDRRNQVLGTDLAMGAIGVSWW